MTERRLRTTRRKGDRIAVAVETFGANAKRIGVVAVATVTIITTTIVAGIGLLRLVTAEWQAYQDDIQHRAITARLPSPAPSTVPKAAQ